MYCKADDGNGFSKTGVYFCYHMASTPSGPDGLNTALRLATLTSRIGLSTSRSIYTQEKNDANIKPSEPNKPYLTKQFVKLYCARNSLWEMPAHRDTVSSYFYMSTFDANFFF